MIKTFACLTTGLTLLGCHARSEQRVSFTNQSDVFIESIQISEKGGGGWAYTTIDLHPGASNSTTLNNPIDRLFVMDVTTKGMNKRIVFYRQDTPNDMELIIEISQGKNGRMEVNTAPKFNQWEVASPDLDL